MDTIIFDAASTKDNLQTTISLTAIDSDFLLDNSFGTLVYKAEKEDEEYRIDFSFHPEAKKVNLTLALTSSLKGSCLILCGIALIGPVLDCYEKNSGSWRAFKECLKEQKHALTASSLTCIAACT